jgi:hypothetical protein
MKRNTQTPPGVVKAISPEQRNPNNLHRRLKSGETPTQMNAAIAVEGLAANTVTMRQWSSHIFGDEGLDLTAAVEAVCLASARVRDGNLGDLEMLLTSCVFRPR